MKNCFVLAVLVSLIFSFTHIYSQGIFLEKGEAGLFVDGGYTELENGNATSFGGGFALGGVAEFGFSFSSSKIELDDYYYSKTIKVRSNTVSLGVVLVKKKAQVELNLGYSTSDNSVDILLLGFNIGGNISAGSDLSLHPIFSFAVGLPRGGNSGNPVFALGLSAPFFVLHHVYVGPSIGLSEGNFSWGATAGIIFNFTTSGSSGW